MGIAVQQQSYNRVPQLRLGLDDDIIVDNFAGGGGASTGIEQALGRPVDIAINHDPAAIAMHTMNHPYTEHYIESVWKVDPIKACNGRRVKLAWFSPDCTHFSKSRGKKPKSKKIRGLAWVAIRWIKKLMPTNQHPYLIVIENVEEFQTWGPLLADGQPCPDRQGETFEKFLSVLRHYGYSVDYTELRACDYGAPTIRKRLFIVARRDGHPIVWPKATHGLADSPYRTAADCIDWSIPTKSIFNRKKPLAENTLRRIARGIERFVINDAKPFIVPIQNYGGKQPIVHDIDEPLRTITAQPKGGAFALVAAHIAKHYTGVTGHEIEKPLGTVTTADHHSLVTSHLVKFRGTCKDGQRVTEPMPTITAGGIHVGEVRAFLIKYYGTAMATSLDEPLHTTTTKHRFGLVTIKGEDYQIVDIGLRMLTPRELFNANDFPRDYIIDRNPDGSKSTIKDQVARCGNSVPPAFARAIVRSNLNERHTVSKA